MQRVRRQEKKKSFLLIFFIIFLGGTECVEWYYMKKMFAKINKKMNKEKQKPIYW